MQQELKNILISRHYLFTDECSEHNWQYFNAYLLSNFGIVVDKPASLTKDMVKQISDKFHLTVPKSFYSNPQDTLLFTKDELLIEQIVSYFVYGSDLGRIEIFKKDFPEYVVGDELKLRTFYIVNEEESRKILQDIMSAYCAYTRPFSLEEMDEFLILHHAGFYNGNEIKCKDNIFALLDLDISFARFLDKKDVVKLSIKKFGDHADFRGISKMSSYDRKLFASDFAEIAAIIPYVKHCPMSKKQAKYFNKIASVCKVDHVKMTNAQSPDRRAMKFIAEGNVVAAARIYAESGSMLERRLKMLLSRASLDEAIQIMNLIHAENPVVLYQLLSTLSADDNNPRTFTFFSDNKVKTHRETEYEATWRKSRLSATTRNFLSDVLLGKVRDYYKSLPSLGKIYVADNFHKLGMPTNTSASGKGIDVLPIGSRIPCTGNSIRTFVHWKDAFDIDSSLIVVDKEGQLGTMGWFNYGGKYFGNDILFSGDITGRNGAEYFDIKLDELATKGYKYVIQTFHGYCSKLDSGEIYAGYQNKDNLNTRAWDPKNIETQFRVKGDSRGCIAFAIDIQNREMIILNQIVECDDRVVRPDGFKTIEKYLQPDYLKVNIGMIAECRGELVDNPSEADVVFDDKYVQELAKDETTGEVVTSRQTIIRSWELEKLVALVNS
jgi:hypothetical protein